MLSTYLSYQLVTRDIAASLDRVESQPMVQRETDYYLANIGSVKTIDEFVDNDRLFKYAMKAYGLADMDYAKAFMKKALEEGIRDPDSFANKLTDKRYRDFVEAFNFEKYGEFATSYNLAQDYVPTQFATKIGLGIAQEGFGFAQSETDYFLANISNVTTIDGLMADDRLLSYAMAAFGLDAGTEDPAVVRQMLEGGVTDPLAPANGYGNESYHDFVTAFNFVEFGAATTTRDEVLKAVPEGYMADSGLSLVKPRADYVDAETKYYLDNIGDVKTVSDLLADKRLLTFAMASYGLDASTEDPDTIRTMLEGGVTDPTSPANLSQDGKYVDFVTAFDFAQYGATTTTRAEVTTETPDLYGTKSSLGLIPPSADYIKAETDYYQANVTKLQSIDDLMADKRLLDFALTAYGFAPEAETPEHIRTLLEGGIDDPDSPANQEKNKRYAEFVAGFNFVRYGEIATTVSPTQQKTVDKFMRQTLEENEGKQNEGVRLALYFQRKAPQLTNYYAILGDTALAEVVRTALGLPAALAQADIDKQAEMLEEKFDLADFKDPEKLNEFLERFTTMWEINNPSASSAQSSIAALFTQPVEFGISTNLLLTMAQLGR